MERLVDYIENNEKLPTKVCIINFDDGFISQYTEGLCVLNENKAVATFYIIIDHIGVNDEYMTLDQINTIFSIGHDIESHFLTHPHLSQLSILNNKMKFLILK